MLMRTSWESNNCVYCGLVNWLPNRRQVKRRKDELREAERKTKRCSCEMIEVFFIASSQDRSIIMTSIPRLSGILRTLFFAEANQLARQAG